MDLIISVHYAIEDFEFRGDYTSITILLDGELVATFGDHTDQGMSKARGWVQCFETLRPNLANIRWVKFADEEI